MKNLNTFISSNWRNASSIKLFDLFSEGYDAIRLQSVLFIYDDNNVKWKVDFQIEKLTIKSAMKKYAEATFSAFKNQFMSDAAFFVSRGRRKVYLKQLFAIVCDALAKVKSNQKSFEYQFEQPYVIRAQASHNRMGYGNIYCGDRLVEEGTKYGETDEYLITKTFFSRV